MGMPEVITRTAVQAFVRSECSQDLVPAIFSLGTRKLLFSVGTEVYMQRVTT